jgi:hypothetical protein
MMLTSALEAAHIHLARRRNAASIERSRDAEESPRECALKLFLGGGTQFQLALTI